MYFLNLSDFKKKKPKNRQHFVHLNLRHENNILHIIIRQTNN